MSTRKLIAVSEKTYKRLVKKGTLEDSFDSVISRIMDGEEAAMSGQTFLETGQSTATLPKSTPTSEGVDTT
jgi:hypothetical protein